MSEVESPGIAPKLLKIFRRVFGDSSLQITREMTADEIEGWDSLAHINLILAIEKDFDIRFQTAEIAAPRNIGELVDVVERKISSG